MIGQNNKPVNNINSPTNNSNNMHSLSLANQSIQSKTNFNNNMTFSSLNKDISSPLSPRNQNNSSLLDKNINNQNYSSNKLVNINLLEKKNLKNINNLNTQTNDKDFSPKGKKREKTGSSLVKKEDFNNNPNLNYNKNKDEQKTKNYINPNMNNSLKQINRKSTNKKSNENLQFNQSAYDNYLFNIKILYINQNQVFLRMILKM